MTRSDNRYFKVSPRGFIGEVLYFRVRPGEVDEVNRQFENFEDYANGGHCGWTDDTDARRFGVAVDWADRAYVGY